MDNVLSYFKNGIKVVLTNDNSNVYKINNDNLGGIIAGIYDTTIPDSVNHKYLISISLKSKNKSFSINRGEVIEVIEDNVIGVLPKKVMVVSMFLNTLTNSYYFVLSQGNKNESHK